MFLLNIRLNIVILERDYTCIAASGNDSKGEGLTRVLHYADVILDEHCGILLHPLDQLTSPEGFKMVTTRVTTLSLQYERLWILLYTSESGRLPEWASCTHTHTSVHACSAQHEHPLCVRAFVCLWVQCVAASCSWWKWCMSCQFEPFVSGLMIQGVP